MKKFFLLAFIVTAFAACNDQDSTETTVETTDMSAPVDASPTYTPSEGDVTYRDGKVMVWKNSDWVAADDDVTLDNGVVVHKNEEVKRNDDVVVMKDGQVVNSSGKFFDKTGKAIDDAWDATKKGVGKAGDAVEKAAQKTKDAVTGDDNK